MADLKPCPLCGGTNIETLHGFCEGDLPASCRDCLCHIGNWNHRPIEDAQAATIERLRGLLREAQESVEHDAEALRIQGADIGAEHYRRLLARIDAELEGDGDG